MKDRLTAAALTLANIAMVGGLAATTMATPAQAQGTTADVANNGKACPTGWRSGKSRTPMVGFDVCKPASSNPPSIYLKTGSTCAAGYRVDYSWCTTLPVPKATAQTSAGATLTKTAGTNRCPSGYKTNRGDTMQCLTESANAPTSRAKGGRPCAANEVDEYGFWCTSNYEAITGDSIKSYAMADYNTIYGLNRGQLAQPDIPGLNLTPVYIKRFGNTEGQQAGAATSTGGTGTAQTGPAKSCDTAAQQGAAIGGAVGGARGKALGGLAGAAIGGFGKKKNSGC